MEEKPRQFSIGGLLIATTVAWLFFVAFNGLGFLVILFCLGFGGVLVAGSATGESESDWPKHTLWIGAGLFALGTVMAAISYAMS